MTAQMVLAGTAWALPTGLARENTAQVWILSYGATGDDRQLQVLAEALGFDTTELTLRPNLLTVILSRLFPAVSVWQTLPLSPPWPALVITIGGRNVGIAQRIKQLSGGKTKLVQLGRPWAALDVFDLIISTPQYRLPERANVLHNIAPLYRKDEAALRRAAERWRPHLAHLPRPWVGVLVGGDSGSYRFDKASAWRLTAQAVARAKACGGSLLVTTSPRTPKAIAEELCAWLESQEVGHGYCWQPETAADNPYQGYLALADEFIVTGESASMLAEACATGKPVTLFDLPQHPFSKFRLPLFAWLRSERCPAPLRALFRFLEARGLIVPPRDLGALHRELHALGLLTLEGRATPPRQQLTDVQQAVAAVKKLLDRS
ncbi:MAG: mitochondrial fission ELM1 family protein [Methylococcales bacterium]|nr:mitochondrial fission ELM1 family protein [Methylococcales bacterium]